jgi:hypothetical protein
MIGAWGMKGVGKFLSTLKALACVACVDSRL